MSTSPLRIHPAALSAAGELLVFAPPLLTGFLGAPLALATNASDRRVKYMGRRNWAKRRAYAG